MQHLHQGCYSGSVGCNRYISVPGEDSPDMHPAPLEVGYVLNTNVREAGSGMVCFLDPVTLDSHLCLAVPVPMQLIASQSRKSPVGTFRSEVIPRSIKESRAASSLPGKHRHRNQPGGVQRSLKTAG